jgi:GT2 family glycosyltransferase
MRWSIIICTRNRAADLEANLPALGRLAPPPGGYEVLVVDNGSTDGTAEVVKAAAQRDGAIRYVREERPGLSHARNRGIGEARGELIAFLDDDARPAADWLPELEKGFAEPRVAAVGGRVAPSFAGRSGWPDWLPERLRGFFSVLDRPDRRYLRYPDYPAGTNIAFRTSAFAEVGLFDADLGRSGASLLSMEEVDLCLRLERAGGRILYLPGAVVHHAVREERLTRDWVAERCRWQGISAAIIERRCFPAGYRTLKSLRYLLYIAAGVLGAAWGRLAGNERLGFLCACQVELCRAWLKRAWRGQ